MHHPFNNCLMSISYALHSVLGSAHMSMKQFPSGFNYMPVIQLIQRWDQSHFHRWGVEAQKSASTDAHPASVEQGHRWPQVMAETCFSGSQDQSWETWPNHRDSAVVNALKKGPSVSNVSGLMPFFWFDAILPDTWSRLSGECRGSVVHYVPITFAFNSSQLMESPSWMESELMESPSWMESELMESPSWMESELIESPSWGNTALAGTVHAPLFIFNILFFIYFNFFIGV